MAKVRVEDDCVDIQVSLLERVMLAEKPRKLPLARIRAVDPHPPLLEMMMHWADQGGVWLCGVSAYDGHLIPSSRNPSNTLAIEIEGEEQRYLYVELDDEAPESAAKRIERARRAGDRQTDLEIDQRAEHERALRANLQLAEIKRLDGVDAIDTADERDDEDWEREDVRLRDPLMQGSLAPPPLGVDDERPRRSSLRIDNDRDLARLGGWLVALGSLGVLMGTTIVAAGLLPGLLAVGAGIACGVLGGLALALVAHHQG